MLLEHVKHLIDYIDRKLKITIGSRMVKTFPSRPILTIIELTLDSESALKVVEGEYEQRTHPSLDDIRG